MLVVGAGPIGLSVAAFARATGADVTVMDVNPVRLAFCRARLGIERTLSPAPADNVEIVRELLGELPVVVFDATGHRGSMEGSFALAANGGTVVFVGLVQDDIAFRDPEFHRRELTLLASRNSAGVFPKIIRMIEAGQIDTRPWITHRLDLAAVPEKFPSLPGSAGLVKAMIDVA